MTAIAPEVKVAALKRCFAEAGLDALNRSRYRRWREALPDPRSVPGQFSFGSASEFVALCREHGIPVLDAKPRKRKVSAVYMSDRQLRGVAARFVAETDGPYARREYDEWRQRLSDCLLYTSPSPRDRG